MLTGLGLGLAPRSRLIGRLNAGLHKLAPVSASAGFGRATLLSAWSAGVERSVAWLELKMTIT